MDNDEDMKSEFYKRALVFDFSNPFISNPPISKLDSLPDSLKNAPEEFRDWDDFVLSNTKEGHEIRYASERLKDDKAFILKAVKISPICFAYASDKLRDDENFILELIKISYFTFSFASKRIKKNRKTVLEAIKIDPHCLSNASEKLKDDEEFMMKAIKIAPISLAYAKRRLKNNEEFIAKAIEITPLCFCHASEKIRDNKKIGLLAVRYGDNLLFVSERLKDDTEIVFEALKTFNLLFSMQSVSKRIKCMRRICMGFETVIAKLCVFPRKNDFRQESIILL